MKSQPLTIWTVSIACKYQLEITWTLFSACCIVIHSISVSSKCECTGYQHNWLMASSSQHASHEVNAAKWRRRRGFDWIKNAQVFYIWWQMQHIPLATIVYCSKATRASRPRLSCNITLWGLLCIHSCQIFSKKFHLLLQRKQTGIQNSYMIEV